MDARAAQPVVNLIGVPIDALTHVEVADRVFEALERGHGGYIMTPNLDNLRGIARDPALRNLALTADLRVPDGMPLLWASRLRGTPLPGRVPGSDLIWTLSERAAARRRSVFLLGGSPGTADRAAEQLRNRFPDLTVAGTYCPPLGYDKDPAELHRIGLMLRRANPSVVFVGLPFPKASALVQTVRSELGSIWFLGLGISFSFVCGDIRRAPAWMQKVGLEWVHRLAQEPQRLFRRYLFEGLPFVGMLLRSALADRRRLGRQR
jgi:N-acetylglucosaminyldiphosphoundecaprenol N-acetyl-beta-D-mannosaminyltransferase